MIFKQIHALFFLVLLATTFQPFVVFANGGDQRVLGNEYLVNLARAPFTPTAGTKTAMTVSFVDLKTDRLIQDDLLVTVRVGKGRGSKIFIHEEKNIPVNGGVLDWSYTFQNSGIHELFFDFAFASAPDKLYEPPDFLLDIQKPAQQNSTSGLEYLIMIILALTGFLFGWFVRSIVRQDTKAV